MKTQTPTPKSNPDRNSNPGADESGLWAAFKRLPRPVWIVFLGVFINRFGTFVIPFLALHMTRLGFTGPETGAGLAAYGGGSMAASLIGGNLADAFGRRRTIVLSLFSGAAVMLALSQATSLWSLLSLAFLAGTSAELYRPAAKALLTDLTNHGDRVTVFAAYRFALNAGWAFGPAVGGLIAAKSYVWLFVGDAATALLFGCVAWAGLPPDGKRRLSGWGFLADAFAGTRAGLRTAARDRRYVALLTSTLLVGLVFVQMPTTLGIAMKAGGLSEKLYGVVLAWNGVLIIVFELPLSTWTARMAPAAAIALGSLLSGLGFALFAFGASIGHFVLGMTVFTFGEMIGLPVAMAYVATLAPSDARGRYMGVYGLTWGVSWTIGPVIGMAVVNAAPTALWLGCGVVGVLSAATALRGCAACEESAEAEVETTPFPRDAETTPAPQ